MKKFILMLIISLGGIVSAQAQSNATFNFSCIDYSESDLGFNPDQAPLFSGTQTATLIADGFAQGGGTMGNDRIIDVNHYAYVIYLNGTTEEDCPRCNLTRVTIDAEDNGFVVSVGIPPVPSAPYSSFADAMVFANAQIAFITGEFVEAQEMMLEDSPFNDNAEDPGTWSRTIVVDADGNTAQADIYIYNGQFRANVDGEGRMDFDTLQEAMDFISSFIYTAN